MSSLIVCRILASNYQANNRHYKRAGAKCPIFLVMISGVYKAYQISEPLLNLKDKSNSPYELKCIVIVREVRIVKLEE